MFGYHGQGQYNLIFHQNRYVHFALRHRALYIVLGSKDFRLAACKLQLRLKPKRHIHIAETTLALQAYTAFDCQPEFRFSALVDFAG